VRFVEVQQKPSGHAGYSFARLASHINSASVAAVRVIRDHGGNLDAGLIKQGYLGRTRI